ncbi:MAG: type I-E CRISPR-associated protein Cas6/Cse3/CasE, partial [Caldilineaceae bacterium]|nr:type I-E CRISPR-associated protein Cas6/Cse3/CasE [Caldilineaceae bacterium]
MRLYLSQLTLNPASPMVQSEFENPYEMHRTIMRGFPCKRDAANVLYRLESNPHSGSVTLLVQSTVEPQWEPLTEVGQGQYLFSPPAWKAVDLDLQQKQTLRFRLVANTSVKKDGKRHALFDEEAQRHWLETKGTGCIEKKRPSHGFEVLDMDIQKGNNQQGHIHRDENEKHTVTIYRVQFDGILQVTNPATFLAAIQAGIGSGKAFGFG